MSKQKSFISYFSYLQPIQIKTFINQSFKTYNRQNGQTEGTPFIKCGCIYRDPSFNFNNVIRFKWDVLKKLYYKFKKKMKNDYRVKHTEQNIKVC